MQGEQTHVLPPPFPQFFQQWVDIVLLTNGIRTLADVVINHHQFHMRDLVFGVTSCHGMATTMVAQVKKDFTTINTQQTHFFFFSLL
jgi:hypothetical protein